MPAYILDKKLAAGHCCLKCKGQKYGKGKKWLYRRCKSCGYDEPATAGTLFHKCKLRMLKAFEMSFRVSVRKKGMSGCELSKEKSDKGVGFPLLHTHIMNIKGWWLRGTHHKCGPQRLQNYLDEYHFRFNRRAFLNSAFDKLIGRMAEFEPVFYKMIKCDLNT